MMFDVRTWLLGRRAKQRRYAVVAAGAVFVTVLAFTSLSVAQPILTSVPFVVRVGVPSLVILSACSWYAYENGGVLLAWTLAFAAPFALYLDGFLAGATSTDPADAVLAAAVVGLVYAGVVGTAGFLIGVGVRRYDNS